MRDEAREPAAHGNAPLNASVTEKMGGAAAILSWGVTHPGAVRCVNQDSFLARADLGLWMVADGAGGHEGGAMASQAIASELGGLAADLSDGGVVREAALALQRTHEALRQAALSQRANATIATTVVVLVLRDGRATCLWVGDSRAYRFRKGQLTLLTRDHSLVQELMSAGRITADEAENHPQRNVITRAVGANCDHLAVECRIDEVEPGDLYLLCSDGLSGTLPEAEIAATLERPPSLAANALVAAALGKHARDNVTALVVSLPGSPSLAAGLA